MKAFGDCLRELREARGVMQKELARRVGHPQAWISNRERGTVDVPLHEAQEILGAMGYAADLIVMDAGSARLVTQLAAASPEDLAVVLKVLEALPRLEKGERAMLLRMISSAADAAAEGVAAP